uniref:Uncharacterized protein n=1 Tax=Leptobrachium leishanense TaxID=445787 RepID=A0A8C5QUD3_9ANUR
QRPILVTCISYSSEGSCGSPGRSFDLSRSCVMFVLRIHLLACCFAVEVPLLIHGAPVLSPRGRRPASHTSGTGNVDNNLADFPPGRPSHSNIDNICGKNRPKSKYGRLALPQTGFSHLRRQGNAVNNLEDGYAECCQKKDRLRCWKIGLEDFCSEEFSVKTRHYHCCRKDEPERESCFSSSAPNPSYSFPVPLQEIGSADLPPRGRSLNSCPPSSPKCQRHGNAELPNLSFPPGEPKSSNIQNICKLRKFRPVYPKNLLPQSGLGHYVRQAKAINHVENEFKKCCKEENMACAHTAVSGRLGDRSIKTRPHECCKKKERPSMYSCFSLEAPYPEYDREVESIDLSNVTQDDLQKLCRDHKLLTKACWPDSCLVLHVLFCYAALHTGDLFAAAFITVSRGRLYISGFSPPPLFQEADPAAGVRSERILL